MLKLKGVGDIVAIKYNEIEIEEIEEIIKSNDFIKF